MGFTRKNAIDQFYDIAGSYSQSSTKTLTDETNFFGQALTGQTGAAVTIASVTATTSTLTGLTGMTANSVGNFLTVSGADSAGNNGTFLIITYVSATSVIISNTAGVSPDLNDGSIVWTERAPYTAEDDFNFERTDRTAIKGVLYNQPIPTYYRPTATGTAVPANLSNIAGKTTDAQLFNLDKHFFSQAVASTNTKITLSSVGNLKHANATDKTGVPVFDAAPYVGDYASTYTEIVNSADGSRFEVLAGPQKGNRIFGITNAGASTSPDSVEVLFYSVPPGGDPVTSAVAYTWEAAQITSINVSIPFGTRGDLMSANSFRVMPALGLVVDSDLRQDIYDIRTVIGMSDDDVSLVTQLTNTGSAFAFFNLPDATPSVVEALNTLNAQIGDRTYTGGVLTTGQTIAASLQALSNTLTANTTVRTIERLASNAAANVSHLLPGGISYIIDGTFNGRKLWVYWRGVLRDPGSVANGDDYAETDTTHITPYYLVNASTHINYFVHGTT